jgi:hypothetical protein
MGGVLATFDQSIPARAVRGAGADTLAVIGSVSDTRDVRLPREQD